MTHSSDTLRGPLTSPERPAPSAAAVRMRRHRLRRRKEMRCLTIELRETEVTTLIERGYLKPETRNDLGAVRSALYGFLDRTLV